MSAKPTYTDSPKGLAFALTTYLFWGVLPLYFKAMAHIPPAEVIAHRVLWSLPIAAGVLIVTGRSADFRAALTRPRLLAMAALTATLITVNWMIYVWSVGNDRAMEAALGYYINPLFSICLAALLLGERLGRLQWVAVGLAALAVVILTLETGSLPLVAVGLFFSWGFYAFFKRSLPLGPNQGFLLEVAILSIPALAYLFWLHAQGGGHFGRNWRDTLLLIGCGPVTAVPLIFYANAAKLLKLSTIGILQYITPTMVFLIAVLVFGEPFDGAKRIAFPLIWAALVIYSYTLIKAARSRRRAVHNETSLRPE
ncbi:MAG TPA: EamA family transporter RarD [Paracoccus sp. (in: a-proteobacteria)]|uniref:EamA family transporter RarD n=1 Tax=uncultured Paracoccus sp. TaxID=189685 RepID=UPI0026171E8D|nr:EamA family transporter RarD [uncultured Paracoccus sp.]HMQ40795.1 EamA family transporter RarD [Paracoccus sp. (in: a-proteobacteria)]HMR35520.1 EamA family transporter RarD [Paracoccus sp. (in: a-proteobacteria)]